MPKLFVVIDTGSRPNFRSKHGLTPFEILRAARLSETTKLYDISAQLLHIVGSTKSYIYADLLKTPGLCFLPKRRAVLTIVVYSSCVHVLEFIYPNICFEKPGDASTVPVTLQIGKQRSANTTGSKSAHFPKRIECVSIKIYSTQRVRSSPFCRAKITRLKACSAIVAATHKTLT